MDIVTIAEPLTDVLIETLHGEVGVLAQDKPRRIGYEPQQA